MTEKKRWSEVKERSSYTGMKLLLLILRYGGRPLMAFCLYGVVLFYFLMRADARKHSLEFLRQVHIFTKEHSPWKHRPGLGQSFRHFMTFANALVDKCIVWLGYYKAEDLLFTGLEHHEALQEKKQGALVIMSHLGNVEICRVIGAFKGIGLTILSYHKNTPTFQRLLSEMTQSTENVKIISIEDINAGLAMQLQEGLNRGEYVIIAGDRYPVDITGRCEAIPFLGRKAEFAQGPLFLGALFSCPILLLFCLKEGKRYHIYFEKFSDGLQIPRREREVRLRQEMERYVARLEYYVCRYPLQWFNFFGYWLDEK